MNFGKVNMLKAIKNEVRLILKNFSFLLILFVLFCNNGLRAEEKFVGFVDTIEGTAYKKNKDNLEESVELKEFDQIFIKDKITIDKASSIIISFTDNSLLTLKGNSEFFVEKFNKTSSKTTFILSIPKGKFSFESESIA